MYSDATSGVQPPAPDFDRMPAEMKEYPNWVCWKIEIRDGKPTKVPYDAKSGKRASVIDKACLSSFDTAKLAYMNSEYSGVGFVFGPNDPFAGIDLDDSDDDLEIKAWQYSILVEFDSYAELSPSGRGIHIIVKAAIPQGRRRDCVEIYSTERFFTMTGNVYRKAPIADRHTLLNGLWTHMRGSVVQFNAEPYFRATADTDDIIYKRAASAANATKFLALWNGDGSVVEGSDRSPSAVDQALVNVLQFYCKDPTQIERLWLASPQGQRSKTQNRRKYRHDTIIRAFDREIPPASTDALLASLPFATSGAATPVHEPAFKRGMTAADLMAKQFNPVRYVVPGYIAEGVTLLAGAPKIGKSWMALGLCISVASGEPAFGKITVEQGDVLYLALEDNERRLQKRLSQMGIAVPLHRLTLVTQWPDMNNGCVAEIDLWIASVERPLMIVIDVLNRVRAPSSGRQPQYEADYNALTGLQSVAGERGIAIVVIHHTRKMEADDPFDLVSGTRGLTGAADTVIVLNKDKGAQHSVIYGRGRDIEEIETAVQFDADTGRWIMLGSVYAVAKTAERQAILDALTTAGKPMSPSDVAHVLGKERTNVSHLLSRMVDERCVTKVSTGLYTPFTPFTPVTINE